MSHLTLMFTATKTHTFDNADLFLGLVPITAYTQLPSLLSFVLWLIISYRSFQLQLKGSTITFNNVILAPSSNSRLAALQFYQENLVVLDDDDHIIR